MKRINDVTEEKERAKKESFGEPPTHSSVK